MNLQELLNQYYPKESQKLKRKFPKMYEFSKEVKIIEWQEEFQIADRNPELFDNLEVIELMFKSNLITEEEYKEQREKILKSGYASKTMGVAFIENKEVAFREKVPNMGVILHELGHIYFKVSDLSWNAVYGGAENLIYLTLLDYFRVSEEEIKNYISIYNLIYLSPLKYIEDIEKIIATNIIEELDLDISKRIYAMQMMAGTLPSIEVEKGEEILYEEWDPIAIEKHIEAGNIKFKPESLKSNILIFISAYLQDGIRYQDPFLHQYAIGFFNRTEKIIKEIINLFNPNTTVEEYKQLEEKTNPEIAAFTLINFPEKIKEIQKTEDVHKLTEENLIQQLKEHLPIENHEIELGKYGKSIYINEEAKERIKEYLERTNLQLPEKIKEILKENNLI